MLLDIDTFSRVIENAPLISLDLVLINNSSQALLGKRLNRPAKDFWFVPGGRILKDETITAAFERISNEELGAALDLNHAYLLGPYEHFYNDNVFNDNYSTHYIALAYVVEVYNELENLPINQQHSDYRWFAFEEILNSKDVHEHTRWYFEALSNRSVLCS